MINDVNGNLRHNRSIIMTKTADEIIFSDVNCLCFIQIPSKQLKKTQEHRQITDVHLFLLMIKCLDALWYHVGYLR